MKYKVRYIGDARITNRYGRFVNGDVFEAERGDYLHFIEQDNYEDAEIVAEFHCMAANTPNPVFHKRKKRKDK